jgi:hypothetical protein
VGREQFPVGFEAVPDNLIENGNDDVPYLYEVFERKSSDARFGRPSFPGDGYKLAAHLNCALVDSKPNFYGISLLSPLDLLRQDQGDQYVSPMDCPVDYEGHNKNRHQGCRLLYECLLDAMNVEVDSNGYLTNFRVDRKLNLSLGLGYGRDTNKVGPPAQITHLCCLVNGAQSKDVRGHG